jgi:hypothetical protein
MKFVLVLIVLGLCGCQAAKPKPMETQTDTISGLKSMTEGLTDRSLSESQLKNLGKQVAHDPQAQSAIRSINTALSPVHTVKYCPENGERFSADQEWCPDHKVKLEWVE